MKKVTQVAVVLFVLAISIASCQKCETCTVYKGDGTVEDVYPEQCDKEGKAAIEAEAKAAVNLLQIFGDMNANYECN